MRKLIAVLLVAAMVLIPVLAQGAEEEKPVTIEFWTHEDANREKLENRYIEEFEEKHPNVTVNVTRQSAEKLIELVQTAFAAGQGPTMFNLAIEDEYPLLAAGRLAPINYKAAGFADAAAVKEAYLPGMLDAMTVDGDVYGLPLELTHWCIFLNKKVFKDAGLDPEKDYPKTWEDMVEVSKKLAIREGDILIRRGYDFRYKYYLVNNMPMVEQLGGQLVSDDGKEAIIGEEAWVKFLTFMQNWGPYKENLGSPTYTAARKLFNKDNNDIGMCSTGMYQEARIRHDNPDFYNSGEWMVVPYPQFKDAVKHVPCNFYGHYYVVNADADKATQKAAWELISYMLSHGEEYLQEVAIIQPTQALMNSETFKNMPYADVFKADLDTGHIVYYGASSTELQSLIGNAVTAVMLQGVEPKQAYLDLKKAAQELLDEQQ